ncbi:MAG: LysR family transcriptional regulator substrate-binding protein, partial [Lachnospiraceae bacterium]|nr:LysR family transcriptional regulator substrate-binding protein [Lachnospiraceae bacterium]
FSIHETRTRKVLENVRDLKSEVGIVSYSGTNEDIIKKLIREYMLEFVPLMRKETYVYVWKNHEFAKRKEISIEELSDYPCISFDQSDNSAFYLSEEAMADYDFKKVIKSDDRATTMEMIAELGGYSIGSGMLTEDDAILRGMVSIKLKEEDPLIIGYITRKGSTLSKYGKAYVEELKKYKEI